MKKILFGLGVLILSITGTNIFAADPAGDTNLHYTAEQRSQFSSFLGKGQAFIANLSLDEIQAMFGTPLRVHATFRGNKYDPLLKDSFTVLVYHHFIFRIYRSENTNLEFVTHFSMLTDHQDAIWSVKPGISEKELRIKFGEPTIVEKGRLTWEETSEDGSSAIICHLMGGIVERIDFSFYYE